MYLEKMEPILKDLENRETEIAGGSVVGMVLSTVNSLITYIANLTTGKKKYENVQDKIQEILREAEILKDKSLQVIDKDKQILEELLTAYKIRKENEAKYQKACKEATDFCMEVVYIANDTLKLSKKISEVGNKMLVSDFKICKYYATASIQAALENVHINVKALNDEQYKEKIQNECKEILETIFTKN